MSPEFFSTGMSGFDRLLEGLRPGDNLVFHVSHLKLYLPFVQALVARCRQTQHPLGYLRADSSLDYLVSNYPGLVCFDCTPYLLQDPTLNSRRFTEDLQAFIVQQDAFVHYLAPSLTRMAKIFDSEAALWMFYKDMYGLLFRLETIAYWSVLEGTLSSETVAAVQDTAQIFLDVTGESGAPVIQVRKAWGRYSELMAWPHRLHPRTGEVTPIHEAGPTDAELHLYLQDKLHELTALRSRYHSMMEEARAIVELSRQEMECAPLSVLLDTAVARVARVLDAEFVCVLEYLPDDTTWRLSAGTGWRRSVLGHCLSEADLGRWIGEVCRSCEPVVAEDIRLDPRFHALPFLEQHGVVGAVGIGIQGAARPFGFLGVFTSRPRRFTEDEVHFLKAVANLLSVGLDRREAEQELHDSRARLQAIIDMSEDALISLDSAHRITLFSRAAENIFGYRSEEVLGGSLDRLIPDRFREVHRTHVREFLEAANHLRPMSKRPRIVGLRRDGTEFPAEASLAKFQLAEETVMTVRLRDITELVRAEERVRRSEMQLRQAQKMEALGTLAGGIAHDFNNILTAMLGYAEIASMEVRDDRPLKRYLQEILRAGQRAKELIAHILSFSRRDEPMRKLIHPHLVVQEALELLSAALPKTIQIQAHLDPHAGMLFADPVQLQQVVMNLCMNAEQAMRGKGGILVVRLDEINITEAMAEERGLPQVGPHVRLIVQDTGCGMSPDVKARIFEPFFTTKAHGEGTGMGLAVVHGIVSSHGGMILVESAPGRGTTVTIYFPLQREFEQDAPKEREQDQVPWGHERILFVDDEESITEVNRHLLEFIGYHVTTTTQPLTALEWVREDPSRFDMVITDQTMPQMTGEGLARELLRIRPDLPVILCTGFSHEIDAEQAKAVGIRAFVMKPFLGQDLARLIRDVLDDPRAS